MLQWASSLSSWVIGRLWAFTNSSFSYKSLRSLFALSQGVWRRQQVLPDEHRDDGLSGPCPPLLLHPEYCRPTRFSEFAKDKESSTRNSPGSNPSPSPRVGVGDVDGVCCCKLVTCPTLCPLEVCSLPRPLGTTAAEGQTVLCLLRGKRALSQPSEEALTVQTCVSLLCFSFSFSASLCSLSGHTAKL